MSKKTDQFGNKRHPGECYRTFKANGEATYFKNMSIGKAWKFLQRNFKKRKRIRKMQRLMRKGRHPRRTMRPRIR